MCVHEVGTETCVRCEEEKRVNVEEDLGVHLRKFEKKYCQETRPNGVPKTTEYFDDESKVLTWKVKTAQVPAILESLLPNGSLANGQAKMPNDAAPLSSYVEAAQRKSTKAADWWDEVDAKRYTSLGVV